MPIRLKARIMDTNILPTPSYGCQTWTLTEINPKKISICQNSMEQVR